MPCTYAFAKHTRNGISQQALRPERTPSKDWAWSSEFVVGSSEMGVRVSEFAVRCLLSVLGLGVRVRIRYSVFVLSVFWPLWCSEFGSVFCILYSVFLYSVFLYSTFYILSRFP